LLWGIAISSRPRRRRVPATPSPDQLSIVGYDERQDP
jgi:hypothetical protein